MKKKTYRLTKGKTIPPNSFSETGSKGSEELHPSQKTSKRSVFYKSKLNDRVFRIF